MVKEDFSVSRLWDVLERSLGFALRSLELLPGRAWSVNLKAVRATDGLPFLVKLTPKSDEPKYRIRYENLSRHLADLTGTMAAQELFPDGPREFGCYRVRFLSWCEGIRVFPDKLTKSQLMAFLDDYMAFSAGMQKTSGVLPKRDGLALRREILDGLRGGVGEILRRRIEADMPIEDVGHEPSLIRIIHGDFHYGNFLFVEGRVTGFFDLEEFRYGYPAEDIIRYFVCATEHLRWYELNREKLMLSAFEMAVARLPYSTHEWMVAINGLFLLKIAKRVRNGCGIWQMLNLLWRAGLYRRLRSVVRKVLVARTVPPETGGTCPLETREVSAC